MGGRSAFAARENAGNRRRRSPVTRSFDPEGSGMERYPTRSFNRKKACTVCGRELESYVRICDRCGSIQRPAGGDGIPIPPEDMDTCENCGQQYFKEDKTRVDNLCPDCDALLNAKKRRLSGVARERITYVTFGSFAAASVAAAIWVVLAGASATMVMEVLGIAGLVLIISAASLAVVITNKRRRIRPRTLPMPELEDGDEQYLP